MMSVYRKYLESKDKDELIDILLSNKATSKAVRNEMIVKEYISMENVPRMDAYCHLSERYKISELMVMKIVQG